MFHIPLDEVRRRDSSPSLALSPLTTARDCCDPNIETQRGSTCSGDVSTHCKSTSRSSMVMAKLDVSDFLAPLESRIYVRLDALESMVDRRCSELEQRFAEVTNMPGTLFQQQLDEFRKDLTNVQAKADATSGKSKAWAADLAEKIHASDEKQAALRGSIDELWRQLKADRNQGQAKYQELGDALESHVQKLTQRIAHGPCGLAMAIEEEGDDFDPTIRAHDQESEFVVRSRSTPTIPNHPMARERSPPNVPAVPRSGTSATSLATPLRSPPSQSRSARIPSPRNAVSRVLGSLTGSSHSARQGSPTMSRPSGGGIPERRASAPHEAVQRLGAAVSQRVHRPGDRDRAQHTGASATRSPQVQPRS